MRYNSKKDLFFAVMLWGTVLICLFVSVMTAVNSASLLLTLFICLTLLLPAAFIAWSWFTTYYELHEDHLLVRSGPLKRVIFFNDIRVIRKSRSLLSSPALSLDRIEIVYGYNVTYISPSNREKFISQLKMRCPHARVEA